MRADVPDSATTTCPESMPVSTAANCSVVPLKGGVVIYARASSFTLSAEPAAAASVSALSSVAANWFYFTLSAGTVSTPVTAAVGVANGDASVVVTGERPSACASLVG